MSQRLFSLLNEQGIKIKADGRVKRPGHYEMDCPKEYCKEARKGTDLHTPLRVDIIPSNDYAKWRCRHCLWSGHVGEEPTTEEAPPPPAEAKEEVVHGNSLDAFPPAALEYLESYGIVSETIDARKLSWNAEVGAIKVPYLHGDEVINAAFISPDGKSRLGTARRIEFYGLDRFNPLIKSCVIAHRELDAIMLTQLGFDNVLAVPNGGDIPDGRSDDYEPEEDKFRFLESSASLIQACNVVVLAFDDTEAGLLLRQELSRRIGPAKCRVVKYSRGTLRKTCLKMSSDDVCADIGEAKPLPIFGLYEIDDFEQELLAYFDHGMSAGHTTGWPNVDSLYTVAPGQLTLVTGIPNSGKSEWIDALTLNLALDHGWRFAAFSPENGKEAHATKLIEKRVEMSADPRHPARMSADTFYQGSLWVRQHYTFIESKDEQPTLEWILARATDAVLRKGIKGLIIDPWNRIGKDMTGFRSETDFVAHALPRILAFLVNYGVHCWLVVHPKQQEKDRKTGKIPPPSLYDCAGSAHFVNMCDNGIVVHRADSVDDATSIYVNKVRFKHIGRRGNTQLAYNTSTGRYSPLDAIPDYSATTETDGHGIKSYLPEDDQ